MHPELSAARQNDPYFEKRVWNSLTGYLLKTDSIKKQWTSYLNEVFELACPNNLKEQEIVIWNWFVLSEKLTRDKTHSFSLFPQCGIKPQRFSQKPTALILSNVT